ncbi:uncharacterized protein LOC121860593 isoform X2 [Homarus americanus]|uniref:uncharacterized protein LOC121860593 isoform X2 n=1 Tax=Homarus americanus TaxID=6706 RepID=UPI001C45F3B5|nr:uncharacterized protein LOC121860593 isoform X2 [Homarus americanus]XP_042213715.1 uncharacterized protein LOC121860593 isoform X2 [Homarus americanus]
MSDLHKMVDLSPLDRACHCPGGMQSLMAGEHYPDGHFITATEEYTSAYPAYPPGEPLQTSSGSTGIQYMSHRAMGNPEPHDVTIPGVNGEVPPPIEEHLSSSENNDFASCMCHIYESMAAEMEQVRRAKAAASRRECRRRQLESMTEEEKRAKHREEAVAQKKYRQRKLDSMTDEQRRAYRAAVAESQRMRRRLRMESMSEEELKAYRAEAAATQRRKRQVQRQKMTDEELQMHRAVEAALRRYRRKSSSRKETNSHRRAAAKARREIQLCQLEEGLDEEEDIEQYVAAAASAQRELDQYREEYDMNAQQHSDMQGDDTTPENLMVQLLMQAQQHADALHGVQGQEIVVKQEMEEIHYPQQERMNEEHHMNAYMYGQPQVQGNMTQH